MKALITILKLSSAVLFLFLRIPGEKISIPVYFLFPAIVLSPISPGNIVFLAAALTYLIIFIVIAFRHTLSHDRLSLFLLMALYIPVAGFIGDALELRNAAVIRTYLFFIIFSFITIILIALRMIRNKYTDYGSIAKPFRKWVSRALMGAFQIFVLV